MKPAIIADLGAGTGYIDLPDVLVMDREWLRASFGPHREESIVQRQREFVRNPAAPQYARTTDGRVGEVMDRTAAKVWLRLRGSSYETDHPADTVAPCDPDGGPLPTPGQPA